MSKVNIYRENQKSQNGELDSNVNSGSNRDINNNKLIGSRTTDDNQNRISNNKTIWERIDD